jgi:hypothetical protein
VFFIGLLVGWALGYWALCVDGLFSRFFRLTEDRTGYFGSREQGTEQEPIFSVPVPDSFGSVLGSRFFCAQVPDCSPPRHPAFEASVPLFLGLGSVIFFSLYPLLSLSPPAWVICWTLV